VSLANFENKFHILSVRVPYLKVFLNFFFLCIFNSRFANPSWRFRNLIYYFLTYLHSSATRPSLLSFLFPLHSQFRKSLLKPSIMVRQSHTGLNLDIILAFVHASAPSAKTYIQLLTQSGGLFLEKLLSFSVNFGILWNQTFYQSLNIRLSLPPHIVVSHMNPAHIVIPQSLKSY